MEARAVEKHLRTSPYKMRRILGQINGKNVEDALNYLHFSPKRSSNYLEKALRSAVSNFFEAYEGKKITTHDLWVKQVTVDGGPALKRFRPMSMGRVGRIRRRTCHLTVVVENKP
jgi:large subunit ribosomal protein L22